MKESIGFTVSLNIMIVFISIVVAFLCAALIYFKSNKVSNIITSAVEKFEGYNSASKKEIAMQLSSIGYGSRAISCDSKITEEGVINNECVIISDSLAKGENGYCIYMCNELNGEYYYYKIRTNMMINIPIIGDVLDIPIYSNTTRLYKF